MNKQSIPSSAGALNRGALQIAGIYLILGSLWILFSDQIAARIALSKELLALISVYKGWGYLLLTALLLYWLIRNQTVRLHASDVQLHRVIDALPALVSYIDKDRRYQLMNKAYAEWFGEKTLGEHMQEVLGEAAYKKISKYVDKVLRGEATSFETEIPYQDGGERYVHATYIPDVAANGQIKGFFVLVQDMTERNQTQEELRRWADAFEGCAHGIAISDPNTNRILVCNPAFASLHKSRVEDIIGSAILSLYRPGDQKHVRRNIEKADQIGHVRYEAHMVRKDGSIFPVEMDVVSVLGEDGDVLHRVETAQDISERKFTDEKLRESETKYRTLVEHLPAITYISEPDQYVGVSYISPQIEALGFPSNAWLTDPEFWLRHIHPEDREQVVSELNQYEAGADSFKAEYRLMLPGGETRWFHDESIRVKDQVGKTLLKQGFMLDITESKKAEEVLQESEERYRIVSELTSDYAYRDRVEADGSIIPEWITESFTRITGYTLEETRSPGFWQRLVHPEDVPILLEHMQTILSGQPHTMEVRVITKSGQERWLRDYSNPIWDADQARATGLHGAVQDITEYKRAEQRLMLQALWLDQINDAVITSDTSLVITGWNPAAERIYGWKAEEVIGKTGEEILKTEFFSKTRQEILQELRESGKFSAEITQLRKDGSRIHIETRTVLLRDESGQEIGNLSVNRDISERKQGEENLRRFQLLSEHSRDIILFMAQDDGRILEANAAAQQAYGYSRDELLALTVQDLRATDVRELTAEQMSQAGAGGILFETIHCRKDGTTFPVEVSSQGATINGVRTLISIIRDITERKQIEKALQAAHNELELKIAERTAALSEANALLQALMDSMPEHIYFKDTQSRFIRNSRSQARLLGLSDPAEAVGKSDFDFFPHAAKAYAEEQEVMSSGIPLIDFEEWVVWPDGKEMWVSTTKMPLRNSDGQTIGIFGISHDITERKRAEQEIRELNTDLEKQAEQLQSSNKELEAFSYSVSHDLRAPLRAIDGYTRILVEDYTAILDEEGRRICGIISAEARRMGQLIDDLLAFSRLGRKEIFTSKIDMKDLVVSVLNDLIKEEDRPRLKLHIARLPSIRADASLIRQVWVNLLDNAIKFTSRKARALIEVGSKADKDEVIYYVRDTGAGFDMEYGNKLFGVFQRLHSENEFEGTGVGLAIVQRIIRRHGGHVWAEGEMDKGATFYFTLPRKETHYE